MCSRPTGGLIMQSYPLKPHFTVQFSGVSFSFLSAGSQVFTIFMCCHFSRPWCVLFMVFIHFSDCFLCFTYVMGTLVQFTLLLCFIGSYMFPGGVGTCVFNIPCPVFTVGKSCLVVVAVQGAPDLLSLVVLPVDCCQHLLFAFHPGRS